MLRIIRYLFLGLLPWFLSGCVITRSCFIETLQPASLSLPDQKQSIAVCASSSLLSKSILSNAGTFGIHADSLVMNILQSVKVFWEQSSGFEDASISLFVTEPDVKPDVSNFDLVAYIEQVHFRNTYYAEQYYYLGWETFFHVLYTADWSIYDKTGKLLDEYSDRDLIVWPSGIHQGKAEAVMRLPLLYDTWWDTGIALARSYANRISPQWKTDTRTIYMINKFPDLSERAHVAMQNDAYGRASNIWEEMLIACRKNGQKNIKSQITYNIAVSCEFENRLDDAVTWVEQSMKYSKNAVNTGYLQLLKKRQQQSLLLDQQLSNEF